MSEAHDRICVGAHPTELPKKLRQNRGLLPTFFKNAVKENADAFSLCNNCSERVSGLLDRGFSRDGHCGKYPFRYIDEV